VIKVNVNKSNVKYFGDERKYLQKASWVAMSDCFQQMQSEVRNKRTTLRRTSYLDKVVMEDHSVSLSGMMGSTVEANLTTSRTATSMLGQESA
jgi:hypothetical protein